MNEQTARALDHDDARIGYAAVWATVQESIPAPHPFDILYSTYRKPPPGIDWRAQAKSDARIDDQEGKLHPPAFVVERLVMAERNGDASCLAYWQAYSAEAQRLSTADL